MTEAGGADPDGGRSGPPSCGEPDDPRAAPARASRRFAHPPRAPAPAEATSCGSNARSAGCRSSETRPTATFAANRAFAKARGSKRMFLHSLEISFDYAFGGRLPCVFGRGAAPGRVRAARSEFGMDGACEFWQGSASQRTRTAMILPKSNRLTPEQLAEVTAIVGEFGCSDPADHRCRPDHLRDRRRRAGRADDQPAGGPGLRRPDRPDPVPFKLMDRRRDLASHRIMIGGVTLGEELMVIAGPVHDRSRRIRTISWRRRPRSRRPGPTSCAEASGSRGPIPTRSRATASRSTS